MSEVDLHQDTQTDHESGDAEFAPPRAWLVYVGSSENGFADAGTTFPLDDVTKVRFGRALRPGVLEQEITDEVCYLGIPIGWVSGVHCELRIGHRTLTHDFDLQDLQSRNGTHIEGQGISTVTRLPSGAVFEVGRSFWLVHSAHSTTDAPAGVPLDPETASPFLRHVGRSLRQLAPSSVSLLLSGETGTGKERLARLVHEASGRGGKFVRAHLGAFSAARLEDLLFGEADGVGRLLERARGGTLFLENVGELSADAQGILLSAITDEVPGHDIRIICSTVRDMRSMATDGRFRGDLYSRLAGFEAVVPPLRERREDLGLLVSKLARDANGKSLKVSTSAFRRILSASWPFNVRQLAQTMTAAVILAGDEGVISREILDEILGSGSDLPDNPEEVSRLRERLVRALSEHGGDVGAVAAAFSHETQDVERWLRRFDLSPDAYRH